MLILKIVLSDLWLFIINRQMTNFIYTWSMSLVGQSISWLKNMASQVKLLFVIILGKFYQDLRICTPRTLFTGQFGACLYSLTISVFDSNIRKSYNIFQSQQSIAHYSVVAQQSGPGLLWDSNSREIFSSSYCSCYQLLLQWHYHDNRLQKPIFTSETFSFFGVKL